MGCCESGYDHPAVVLQSRIDDVLYQGSGVPFTKHTDALKPAGENNLRKIRKLIFRQPEIGIKVQCFVGKMRSDEAHQLSHKRAAKVKTVLEEEGCLNLITAQGMGYADDEGERTLFFTFEPQSSDMREATQMEAWCILEQMCAEAEKMIRGSTQCAQPALLWNQVAKLRAEFAYMRALIDMPGFVQLALDELDKFDTSHDGNLDIKELERCAPELLIQHGFVPQNNMTIKSQTQIIKQFFHSLDRDHNGFISRPEFVAYIAYCNYRCYEQRINVPELFA